MGFPYFTDGCLAYANCLGHRSRAPMGTVLRLLFNGFLHNLLDFIRSINACPASLPKKRSTMFSHEEEVGMKCKSRVFFEPFFHLKMFVGGVIGWEARHVVLYVESIERARDRALLYTALTRLKRHVDGSVLTVVCSCPDLYDFGSQWPDFQDLTANHTFNLDSETEEIPLPF